MNKRTPQFMVASDFGSSRHMANGYESGETQTNRQIGRLDVNTPKVKSDPKENIDDWLYKIEAFSKVREY